MLPIDLLRTQTARFGPDAARETGAERVQMPNRKEVKLFIMEARPKPSANPIRCVSGRSCLSCYGGFSL